MALVILTGTICPMRLAGAATLTIRFVRVRPINCPFLSFEGPSIEYFLALTDTLAILFQRNVPLQRLHFR